MMSKFVVNKVKRNREEMVPKTSETRRTEDLELGEPTM